MKTQENHQRITFWSKLVIVSFFISGCVNGQFYTRWPTMVPGAGDKCTLNPQNTRGAWCTHCSAARHFRRHSHSVGYRRFGCRCTSHCCSGTCCLRMLVQGSLQTQVEMWSYMWTGLEINHAWQFCKILKGYGCNGRALAHDSTHMKTHMHTHTHTHTHHLHVHTHTHTHTHTRAHITHTHTHTHKAGSCQHIFLSLHTQQGSATLAKRNWDIIQMH